MWCLQVFRDTKGKAHAECYLFLAVAFISLGLGICLDDRGEQCLLARMGGSKGAALRTKSLGLSPRCDLLGWSLCEFAMDTLFGHVSVCSNKHFIVC